jgi:protease-4
MTTERSGIARFFGAIWKFIDGTRKLFLNLLFFGFLLVLLSVALAPEDVARLDNSTTLVVRPYGNIVDEYSTTPLDRLLQELTSGVPSETRLRDLLTAMRRAADDPRISQMLIDTDYMGGIGLSSLKDLEFAVAGFKDSGKPVVAMGQVMSQHQYYLASLADEVWLNPGGMVWLDGYAAIRNYFRDALDKLEVEVNLFRAGEYKSAMEPFIRNDMSDEAREAARLWLDSLWQQYLDGVSRNRGIPLEALSAALAEMPERVVAAGGDMTAFALQTGLVDRVVSHPEARQELALRGAASRDGDGYRAIEVNDYLALRAPLIGGRAEVVVVAAEGAIVAGQSVAGAIGADTLSAQLRDIGRQDSVQAVVLRINSPGGDAIASERIRRELQALRDIGKTVVVSMGDVAASGGYWIAMGGEEVWSSPATITGSIGVFGFLPTFGATLANLGVYTDGVGTTELAGTMRIDRPLDPQLAILLQSSVEGTYRDFLQLVADARGMSISEVDAVARGRVWSGSKAAELGLVDRLGTLQDAVDSAARIAGLGSDYGVEWFQPRLEPFEQLLVDALGGMAVRMPSLAQSQALQTGAWLQHPWLREMLLNLEAISAADGQLTIAAYCMCELR